MAIVILFVDIGGGRRNEEKKRNERREKLALDVVVDFVLSMDLSCVLPRLRVHEKGETESREDETGEERGREEGG